MASWDAFFVSDCCGPLLIFPRNAESTFIMSHVTGVGNHFLCCKGLDTAPFTVSL